MKRYDQRGMYPPLQMVSVPTGDWVLNIEAEYELSSLQAQLAERDKDIAELHNALHERDQVILGQQAIIDEVSAWAVCAAITDAEDMYQNFPRIVAITCNTNLSALEAALKAERIKTLEDAAAFHEQQFGHPYELRRMVNELNEQS